MIRRLYDRLLGRTQQCRFCEVHTRREHMKARACPSCVRENLAWLGEVDGWQLTREVGT